MRKSIRKVGSPERAKVSKWFFKTGPGEYGEGDRFLGVTVPALRKLAREYQDLPPNDIITILTSRWHEERLLALLNNWDLVDLSAAQIVGSHLERVERGRLRRLARSGSLWERRIAMIATYHYIRQRDFKDALAIAELLLDDEHDLIHKAAGWMLREVGKRDRRAEERFLRKHAHRMPRTMLRYAIERFPEPLRRRYLAR